MKIVGPVVDTGLPVKPGDTVTIIASGMVDFGRGGVAFGAPLWGPDGDTEPTPADYPAPHLRKNSLIAHVGGVWYQCGTATTFAPLARGVLELRANDAHPQDNGQGWDVVVTHFSVAEAVPIPPVPPTDPITPTTSTAPHPPAPPTDPITPTTPTAPLRPVPPVAPVPEAPGLVSVLQVPNWVSASMPAIALITAIIALARQRPA